MNSKQYPATWFDMIQFIIDKQLIPEESFDGLNSELDILRLMRNEALLKVIESWFNNLKETDDDDPKEAARLRKQGNRVIGKEEGFYYAYELYTKALFATSNCLEASLAHANRAYVLLKLGYFKEAYDDCECALFLGYRDASALKVICRQATCACFVNNVEIIESCIKNLEKFIDSNESNQDAVHKLAELKEKYLELVAVKQPDEDTVEVPGKKIKLRDSPQQGNYIVADEFIQQGDIIQTENPFAMAPIFPESGSKEVITTCQSCAETDITPFPCYTCRKVAYCSIVCRRRHEPVHQIECAGYRRRFFQEIGIGYLALRVLLRGFPDFHLHLHKLSDLENKSVKNIWDSIADFRKTSESPYVGVLHLLTNLAQISTEDIQVYCLTVLLTTCYLRKCSTFFQHHPLNVSRSDQEWIVCSLLLKHITQMLINAHCVSEMDVDRTNPGIIWRRKNLLKRGCLHRFKKTHLFTAIYPKISLYNHSCEPSFRNRFNKAALTIIALKSISKGTEIFNCYALNFRMVPQFMRKSRLKEQYGFECKCEHCVGNDSEYKKFHTYTCENSDCRKKISAVKYYPLGTELDEMEPFRCRHCNVLQKHDLIRECRYILDIASSSDHRKLLHCCDLISTFRSNPHSFCGSHAIFRELTERILYKYMEHFDTSLHAKMMPHLHGFMATTMDQFGLHSLEYYQAIALFLDTMILRNLDLPRDVINIGLQISKAVLPDKMVTVVRNYLEEYATKREN